MSDRNFNVHLDECFSGYNSNSSDQQIKINKYLFILI